ncbi:hypothetical protein DVH24_029654 [Malus domestica]|uniref:Uncharacterized protein n=1 Tax=Malus domestica TaxID=3750 RepID=A0A498I1E4_MALDO|nr:hypothetical protein DVH24_029654 [Malus domestica]
MTSIFIFQKDDWFERERIEIESEMKQQSSQGKKSSYQDAAIELGKELMSNLISNHRTASRVSQTLSPTGSVVATSPPDMGMTGVPPVMPINPTVFIALTSSTSLVMHPILSARRTHQQPQSSEEAEQYGEASSIHGEGSQTSNASFS